MPVQINNNKEDLKIEKTSLNSESVSTPVLPKEVEYMTLEVNNNQQTANSQRLNGQVFITDQKAPLVVLYGPTSCGKTMTLVRLAKYFRDVLGFTVEPDRSFRPAYDDEYKQDCDKFTQTINNPLAAPGTSGYMLVDVIANGRILCKIVEAPGEYYFIPDDPQKVYPHYLQKIIMAPNRKVWCAFVEPNWIDPGVRSNYVNRITSLKPQMSENDKVIFIFNKIDLTHFVSMPGVVKTNLAIQYVSNNYPGIFNSFKCTLPIISFFRKYDCGFIPFQTGVFTEQRDAYGHLQQLYAEGNVKYVESLWNVIKKSI